MAEHDQEAGFLVSCLPQRRVHHGPPGRQAPPILVILREPSRVDPDDRDPPTVDLHDLAAGALFGGQPILAPSRNVALDRAIGFEPRQQRVATLPLTFTVDFLKRAALLVVHHPKTGLSNPLSVHVVVPRDREERTALGQSSTKRRE